MEHNKKNLITIVEMYELFNIYKVYGWNNELTDDTCSPFLVSKLA